MEGYARHLAARGYVVVPHSGAHCAALRGMEMPEFTADQQGLDTDNQHVLGGFGAYGNPSSFHHPVVRDLRCAVREEVSEPLFRALCAAEPETRLEMLFDRVCVRRKKLGKPTAEAWHRDVFDGPLHEEDRLFGGWKNCDAEGAPPQHFVCVPGTHVGEDADAARRGGGGFARIADFAAFERAGVDVLVPPGHVLLFYQQLVHTVVSSAPPAGGMVRLFLGHRTTLGDAPLFDHAETLAALAVPKIPSGQRPPMFSPNHFTQNAKTQCLRKFGARFDPRVLEHFPRTKSRAFAYDGVPRFMKPLRAYGMWTGPEHDYDARDALVMTPQRLFPAVL